MYVSKVQTIKEKNTIKLIATIESDAFETFSLWYRFPSSLAEKINPKSGNPFVATLLLPSMKLGEDLEIAMPVSAKLYQSINQIQEFYQSMGRNYSKIRVSVKEEKPSSLINLPSSIGLFFSLGVDSYYSLLRNQNESKGIAKKINHLIVVEGFDIRAKKGNLQLFQDVLNNSAKVARQFDLRLVPVSTNIRELTSDIVSLSWHAYYGAAMASIGLHLEDYFVRYHIASGLHPVYLPPQGSHPHLDKLWSTESVTFVHDGLPADRIEKLDYISDTPIVRETLRVCWENLDGEYNCGRCEKCLRNMISLFILGRLGNVKTFPAVISPSAIRSIALDNKIALSRFRVLSSMVAELKKGQNVTGELKYLLWRERLIYYPRRFSRSALQSLIRAAMRIGDLVGVDLLSLYRKLRNR